MASALPCLKLIAHFIRALFRRELLDHVIVLDERHLKRLLVGYVGYYNEDRVHTRTRDAPSGRLAERRP